MKSITYVTFAVAIISLIWIILPSKTKGPELHTYEVIYSGVNEDWEDGVIIDTFHLPKVSKILLANTVAGFGWKPQSANADNWLLILYEEVGNMPPQFYADGNSDFFRLEFDMVVIDNLVDSLISWREITPAQ